MIRELCLSSVDGASDSALSRKMTDRTILFDSEAEVLYDHIHLAMERARGNSGLTSTGQL